MCSYRCMDRYRVSFTSLIQHANSISKNMSSLCQAVSNNDPTRVRELLYLMGNPNERVYPFVPVYTFCYKTRVRKMLNADRMPDTALFIAVKENKPEICTILLEAGADVNMPLKNYMTPMRYAVEHNHVEICEALVNAGAGSYDDLYHASILGHADICTILRRHGIGATWSVDVFKTLSKDVLQALETLPNVNMVNYTYYSVLTADEETFSTPPWMLNYVKQRQFPLAEISMWVKHNCQDFHGNSIQKVTLLSNTEIQSCT